MFYCRINLARYHTRLAIFKVPLLQWINRPDVPDQLREAWEPVESSILLPYVVADVLPLSTSIIPLNKSLGQFLIIGVSLEQCGTQLD